MDQRNHVHPTRHASSAESLGARTRHRFQSRRFTLWALTTLWLGVLIAGCAKPPHEEIQAAEKTVREAETAGAPIYVPDEFTILVAKLEAAKDEIEAQYKISEFSRDYSRANSLLNDTRARGNRIIAEAHKRREEAKAAALQEKEQAKEAVQDIQKLVERVEQTSPDPVGTVSDELVSKANELNRTLAEVETAIEANNHLVAQDKAKAVQEKSQKLKTEVQNHARKTRP
jgi:hypothetical protein